MGNIPPDLEPPAEVTANMDNDTVVNNSFELALMTLLAGLEHHRQRMQRDGEQRQPVRALARAEQIVGQVVTFAKDHLPPDSSLAQREGGLQAEQFYAAMAPLRELLQSGGGLLRFFGLGRQPSNPETRQERCSRCLESATEATLQYFIAFTERFPDSKQARPWVETAAGFLADLKRVTQDLRV